MIVDSKEHKDALVQLIRQSSFSGADIEFVAGLLEAVQRATIDATDRQRSTFADAQRGE